MLRVRTKFPGGAVPDERQMAELVALSEFISRTQLSSELGKSYGGNRDLYKALGYKKTLTYFDYWNKYKRQDVAKRVINQPPDDTWRMKPLVTNDDSPDQTEFERAWDALVKEHSLWNKFRRVDILSRIGQFSVLLLGFDDVMTEADFVLPVSPGQRKLLYVTPYSEGSIQISQWDTNITSERFGLPETYKITVGESGTTYTRTIEIHHTRLVHVTNDEKLESEVYSQPAMEAVFNRLQDVELIAGSSAEMFWRGAFPGLAFIANEGASIGGQSGTALSDEIDEYIHGLRRYIRLQNMTTEKLNGDISSPKEHVMVQLQLISAETGIPVRKLTGSERGEMASTQDDENWNTVVESRQTDHAEPTILRPFIDKCIEYEVLPTPGEDGYDIVWSDLNTPSDKDKADVALKRSQAVAAYTALSSDAQSILTPEMFFIYILQLDKTEVRAIVDEMEQAQKDADREGQDDEDELERQRAEEQGAVGEDDDV